MALHHNVGGRLERIEVRVADKESTALRK